MLVGGSRKISRPSASTGSRFLGFALERDRADPPFPQDIILQTTRLEIQWSRCSHAKVRTFPVFEVYGQCWHGAG